MVTNKKQKNMAIQKTKGITGRLLFVPTVKVTR